MRGADAGCREQAIGECAAPPINPFPPRLRHAPARSTQCVHDLPLEYARRGAILLACASPCWPASTSGKVGGTVKIFCTKLTSATMVTFNRTPATSTIVRATEIVTTLPTGATSSTVQVVTTAGTLSSNVPFFSSIDPAEALNRERPQSA